MQGGLNLSSTRQCRRVVSACSPRVPSATRSFNTIRSGCSRSPSHGCRLCPTRRVYSASFDFPSNSPRNGVFDSHEREQLAQDRSSGLQRSKRNHSRNSYARLGQRVASQVTRPSTSGCAAPTNLAQKVTGHSEESGPKRSRTPTAPLTSPAQAGILTSPSRSAPDCDTSRTSYF